ncbi:hypothetical protein FOCC_FOCC000026 [Frankliniella occidentalis]|nr:hypothetical protein FOCC_FOCC000026 [Frankliniella occidentalis]
MGSAYHQELSPEDIRKDLLWLERNPNESEGNYVFRSGKYDKLLQILETADLERRRQKEKRLNAQLEAEREAVRIKKEEELRSQKEEERTKQEEKEQHRLREEKEQHRMQVEKKQSRLLEEEEQSRSHEVDDQMKQEVKLQRRTQEVEEQKKQERNKIEESTGNVYHSKIQLELQKRLPAPSNPPSRDILRQCPSAYSRSSAQPEHSSYQGINSEASMSSFKESRPCLQSKNNLKHTSKVVNYSEALPFVQEGTVIRAEWQQMNQHEADFPRNKHLPEELKLLLALREHFLTAKISFEELALWKEQKDLGQSDKRSELTSKKCKGRDIDLCEDDLRAIAEWTTSVDTVTSYGLTEQGQTDQLRLGSRFGRRFPFLRDLARDGILFFSTCPKFDAQYVKYLVSGPYVTFQKGPEMLEMMQRVSTRLGFEETLSFDYIEAMYTDCALETAWNTSKAGHKPAWCSVFQDEDFVVLEYWADLQENQRTGYYDEDFHSKIGCNPIKEMYSFFENAIDDKIATKERARFYFTHDTLLNQVVTFLRLFKDSPPLTDSFRGERQWHVSHFSPFASNFGGTLFRCGAKSDHGSQFKVQFYLNEWPIEFDICNGSVCTWEQVTNIFEEGLGTCDTAAACTGLDTVGAELSDLGRLLICNQEAVLQGLAKDACIQVLTEALSTHCVLLTGKCQGPSEREFIFIAVRYISHQEPVECLLALVDSSASGQELYSCFKNLCSEASVHWKESLLGISMDGTPACTEFYKLFHSEDPNVAEVWNSSHRLDDKIAQKCYNSEWGKKFFGVIDLVKEFFMKDRWFKVLNDLADHVFITQLVVFHKILCVMKETSKVLKFPSDIDIMVVTNCVSRLRDISFLHELMADANMVRDIEGPTLGLIYKMIEAARTVLHDCLQQCATSLRDYLLLRGDSNIDNKLGNFLLLPQSRIQMSRELYVSPISFSAPYELLKEVSGLSSTHPCTFTAASRLLTMPLFPSLKKWTVAKLQENLYKAVPYPTSYLAAIFILQSTAEEVHQIINVKRILGKIQKLQLNSESGP